MTDYANYMRDDPEEMYLTFMKDIQPETTDDELAKLFDGMKGAFESKGFGDAFGDDGLQNMRGFRDMVRLHRDGDVASVANDEAYLSALDIMDRIRKLPQPEVVRQTQVPQEAPAVSQPSVAAPAETVKEAPGFATPQPPRRPARPGMGSPSEPKAEASPEPTTPIAPETPSGAPVPRGRPEMPKFMRDIEAKKRAGGETLKAKVVNRTDSALPPKERLRRNTDFEYGTPAMGVPSPEIIAEAAMQMNPPMHLIPGDKKSDAPMRRSRPGFGVNQVPYVVPKPREHPQTPMAAKTPMTEKPQNERPSRSFRPGFGPVRVEPPQKAPVSEFKEVQTSTTEPAVSKAPEVEVLKMPEPEAATVAPEAPVAAMSEKTPEPDRRELAEPGDICGNRKFPRKEANSLAEDVVRMSKVRELVHTVDDMNLADDDRNRIEGEVKLVSEGKTFNAWMMIDFNEDRSVKAITFDHWEYGLDRPVKFSRLDFDAGEFKKGDDKKPAPESASFSIFPGQPIRPPKPMMTVAPPTDKKRPQGVTPPTRGLTPPSKRPKPAIGGMSR